MRNRRKIIAICKCLNKLEINLESYNINIKRNGEYICYTCAINKAKIEKKFSNSESRSINSKKMWQNEEYRLKITAASIRKNSTDEFRQKQRDRTVKLWRDKEYRNKVIGGVTNALADECVRQKISDSLIIKYQNDSSYKAKIINAIANQPRISSIQSMLYDLLDNFKVQYHKEGSGTVIGYYAFDCLIMKQNNMRKNLLIECQGDYWHSLDNIKRNDKAKFTYINKYFPEYEIMYIWEHEFYTKDGVLDRLKSKLGLDIAINDFDFNDVIIKRVKSSDIKSFLDSYHYIGKDRGGKCFGAYLDGKLIACVVYSSQLRQNIASQFNVTSDELRELSRFCIHPKYHKRNFASWVISRTLKMVDASIVIAYADTTVGHNGTIYKASNFSLDHTIQADYWYVNKDGYVMHKRTLYGHAVKLQMTENEYADKNGYIKQWGGEKLCYIKINKS